MEYKWINVLDEMPNECHRILIWGPGKSVLPGVYYSGELDGFYLDEDLGEKLVGVTHWMEYPQPPETT